MFGINLCRQRPSPSFSSEATSEAEQTSLSVVRCDVACFKMAPVTESSQHYVTGLFISFNLPLFHDFDLKIVTFDRRLSFRNRTCHCNFSLT